MELSTKGGKRKRNKQGDYPTDEAQALEEEAEANQLLGGDSPDSSVEDEEEIMKLAKVVSHLIKVLVSLVAFNLNSSV